MTVCQTHPSLGDKVPIRKFQAFLNRAGGYNIPEDGDFGANTDNIVKDWQTKNGLVADGKVEEKTWSTICDPATVTRPVLRRDSPLKQAVKDMQAKINEVGKYTIPVDGAFGGNTENTVKNWQTRNGLTVDGIVGAQTWVSLCDPSVCKIRSTLQQNSPNKGAVREMQALLNEVGKYGMPEDGAFGGNTVAKVRDWQTKNKLHVDGIVGPNTWPSICDRVQVTRPRMANGYNGYSAVIQLQRLLNLNGNFGISEDGGFGGHTERAVREWQTRYGIIVDGVVGDQMWPTLIDPVCVLRPNLKPGSKLTRMVKEMQAMLNALGGYNIPLDGAYGGHTENTIKNWQTRNGASVDGWVGPATWGTLCDDVACKNRPRLENGSTNKRAVREMQRSLNKVGGYKIPEDGQFGGNTENTVKNWQQKNNREVNGVVEGEMWDTLCHHVCEHRPVLGDKDAIRGLQTMLNQEGNYNLAVDGLFGGATMAAVKDWQTDNELFADGITDEEFWSTICVEHRPSVLPEEAYEMLMGANPPICIDVRPPNQFKKGHCPGAVNVKYKKNKTFEDDVLETVGDRNAKILLCGRKDKQSGRAAAKLENEGFNYVTQILGGFKAWQAGGFPAEQ